MKKIINKGLKNFEKALEKDIKFILRSQPKIKIPITQVSIEPFQDYFIVNSNQDMDEQVEEIVDQYNKSDQAIVRQILHGYTRKEMKITKEKLTDLRNSIKNKLYDSQNDN